MLNSTPPSLLLELPLTFAAPLRRVSVSVEIPDCPDAAAHDNMGGSALDTSLPEGLRVILPLAEPHPPPTVLAVTSGETVHWSAFLRNANLETLLSSAQEPVAPIALSSNQNLGAVDVGIVWDVSRSAAAGKDARLALRYWRHFIRSTANWDSMLCILLFTFGTVVDLVASRVPFTVVQSALTKLQYDGGTDLSLLDSIPCSTPLQEEKGIEQAAVGISGVPVHVPLPAETDQANLTMLRWLDRRTGGMCFPLDRDPERCAAAMAGVSPQMMLTSLRTDLSSDMEALADESLVTLPDHRLLRVAMPVAPHGL
ncbi:hypothetical protein CYMTET_36841 [Cymbomonas tetramitiformis]|uniref:Uncharacterized protein n=1 Tax=Cymbomonas tetramitiformis TaxID=36881 RepID=A0AAE0F718_9CHLO|nr:hypothetical protein CYMTET_36841 [Cymbomonas tetramitiformis]